MTAILKCILGVFVVLCCVQLIEMARVRRDDPINDVSESLQKLMSQVQNALSNDDTVKKILDVAAQSLADGTKFAKDQLSKIGNSGVGGSAAGAVGA